MRVRKFIAEETRQNPAEQGHLCGVLVQFRPERLEQVRAGLTALPGVEIHHATDDGRLVVTVEDSDQATAGDTLHRFHDVAGVVSASLVYHYHDSGEKGEASP
jgi:nitrate reductase NapD